MKYRAVFFDAGETLLAPHPSFAEVISDELARRGHTLEPARVEETLALMPSPADQSETWSTSPEASRRFWGNLYARIIESLGIADPGGALVQSIFDRFTEYESYRMFPDAPPTLHALREAGLIVGLISNFEGWLEEMLASWEVAHLFEVMAISGKVGVEKPDPKIFQEALRQAGAEASESLYVGDHPRIDVEGAQAVGMSGVLIDRRDRYPEYPGRRIKQLTELLSILGL